MADQVKFKVRTANQTFETPGADLDRSVPKAIDYLEDKMKQAANWGWGFQPAGENDWFPWNGPMNGVACRAELSGRMQKVSRAGALIRVGQRNKQGTWAVKFLLVSEVWAVEAITNATPDIEVIVAALKSQFPKHRFGGIYNRRKIANSTTWSQHSWGAAYDAGHTEAGVKDMGDWTVRMADNGLLPAGKVIAGHMTAAATDWSRRTYSPTDHMTHMHVEGYPDFEGTPPLDVPW